MAGSIAEVRSENPQSRAEIKAFPSREPSKRRIEALDLARGIAVSLMILSHGVKGLLNFSQFPEWGLVPVHLITKFSSTLFILVFGISLGIVHLPYAATAEWSKRRRRLWVRALVLLFWYKALTIVEMFHLYSREEILKTLNYQAFPVYVEILGFYALALFWIPLLIPTLKRTPVTFQLIGAGSIAAISYFLYGNFDFWGIEPLKAILVEHEDHYCWGQLSRGSFVFVGIALGRMIQQVSDLRRQYLFSSVLFAALTVLSFTGFLVYVNGNYSHEWLQLALNHGKHPPTLDFVLFSAGGAFLILTVSFAGGAKLARFLGPISLIGKDALQAFIFHVVVLFVFYRYLFDYWHKVSYEHALGLTLLLLLMTAFWIKVVHWLRREKS